MIKKDTEFDKLKRKVERGLEKWEILSSDELLSKDFPDPVFITDKLIPMEGIMVVAGDPNSFKSWLMLWIIKAVALGDKLFPNEQGTDFFKTLATPILWVDEEVISKEIARRWKKLSPPKGTNVNFMASQGFRLDNAQDRTKLLKQAKDKGVGLIVFDSLRSIHSYNENNSQEAQAIINHLHEFTRAGITIMCSHHQRKEARFSSKDPGQRLRGSTALWAGFNSTLSITASQIGAHEIEIIVIQSKLKEGEKTPSFKLIFSEFDGKINVEWAGPVESKIMKEERAIKAIKEFLQTEDSSYESEIITALTAQGLAARTINRAVKALRESGEIEYLNEEEASQERIAKGLPDKSRAKLFRLKE